MAMLEKLARAYMSAKYCSFEGWNSHEEREEAIEIVRAILFAARDLPEEMYVKEAIAYHEGPYATVEMRREWQHLIDSILTPGDHA